MAKMPATKKGQKTKSFIVAEHVIIGDPQGSGKVLRGGDTIRLTKDQAQFLMDMPRKMIEVDLGDFADETETGPANDSAAKAGSGAKADAPGNDPDGAASGQGNAQAEGDSTPHRKRRSL